MADTQPDGTTPIPDLGLSQYGAAIALREEEGILVADLEPGPFTITFARHRPDELWITFGPAGLFDLLDLPPGTGLFRPATAYAYVGSPRATHFMTDPLCAGGTYWPGFNLLDGARATAEGYRVERLEVGSGSRGCDVAGHWPMGTDLLGRVNPLYAVVLSDTGTERLILRFSHVGS